MGEEGSADELPGVEAHDVTIILEPTGVDLGGSQPEPPQVEAVFDNASFDMEVYGGLKQQAVAEINEAAPPKVGMAASNARIRNPPKQYVPSMQGNKYQVALAQITTSLVMSETSKLLLKSMRLCLPRWGWRLAMLILGTHQSSMFPACKVISTLVALAQITTSLGTSETSMAFEQTSVKLMSKGIH